MGPPRPGDGPIYEGGRQYTHGDSNLLRLGDQTSDALFRMLHLGSADDDPIYDSTSDFSLSGDKPIDLTAFPAEQGYTAEYDNACGEADDEPVYAIVDP